jgi:phosphate transport system substrate-binding protein
MHQSIVGRILVAAGCCLCSACGSANDVSLQGAGATFPAPLYKRWFLEYYRTHPDIRTNYQAIGSGAGIRQFNEGLIDFGASDAFDNAPAGNPKKGTDPFLIPMTAGMIAICYNVPKAPAGLKLSRDVYVDIFLGKIEQWNAPAIAALNPSVELPDMPIRVIRRAEGSGTTFAFTSHLDHISAAWKKEQGGPGKGKSVVWPTGVGGKGNAGVAALIQQTPGAVGYLEFGYAYLAELPMARLQNKANHYVAPGPAAGLAALGGANEKDLRDNLHIEIPDPEGDAAYPIVTYTWLLCYRRHADPRAGAAIKHLLEFCLTDGQRICEEIHYLPLPPRVAAKSLAMVKTIETK